MPGLRSKRSTHFSSRLLTASLYGRYYCYPHCTGGKITHTDSKSLAQGLTANRWPSRSILTQSQHFYLQYLAASHMLPLSRSCEMAAEGRQCQLPSHSLLIPSGPILWHVYSEQKIPEATSWVPWVGSWGMETRGWNILIIIKCQYSPPPMLSLKTGMDNAEEPVGWEQCCPLETYKQVSCSFPNLKKETLDLLQCGLPHFVRTVVSTEVAFLGKADQCPYPQSPLQHLNWRHALGPSAVLGWPRVGFEEAREGWSLRRQSYIHWPIIWGKVMVSNSSYFPRLLLFPVLCSAPLSISPLLSGSSEN